MCVFVIVQLLTYLINPPSVILMEEHTDIGRHDVILFPGARSNGYWNILILFM